MVGMLLYACSLNAQSTAATYGSVSVNIISPVGSIIASGMNFGKFSSTGRPGEIILTPSSDRFSTGGIKIPANDKAAEAATFIIQGADNHYALGMPNECLIMRKDGNETMRICYFDYHITRMSNNAETISIGATLNVHANQAAGIYKPVNPFDIVIYYN